MADLSTGMKQKASLAISLVQIRASSSSTSRRWLDVLTAKTVTDFLLELAADGRTVLYPPISSACGEGVRPRGRRHRRAHGGLGNAVGGGGERSLEDAFFDLYAASAKEAS
ncbi:MAG: hypothetical protein ACLTMP_13005 [Eggerthella lenta]